MTNPDPAGKRLTIGVVGRFLCNRAEEGLFCGCAANWNCNMSCLVVVTEDDFLIRTEASEQLAASGFEVVEARDGDEALAILEARAAEVRVLFTDIHMPGVLDGLALAHHVSHRWPRIALLIASGRATPGSAELPKGSRFLAKPYRSEKMVALAKEAVAISE